ncbi:small CPxCG-related zinc finger protein [Natronomonas moolapensis 8.8.11]|uniref:Small CPxCG-related zinc finger protein n=1 Tax=Natronomonas moolapensis (strain DSM 18674 / CECT 7526 / JCM 14361 / 8.8.11) TaxID=268739 RepID=M1XPC7_NATM8|nr:small CPxCG-related zinc finger protein [Natronomonas moolapensis 8.8.11]
MTTTNPPILGDCPSCSATVTTSDVLIQYEVDGQPAVYAECPHCREVVNPA